MITVLLAGTPCSGVSLLTELLRTHRNVFVSPQTGFFSHSILWNGAGNEWRRQYQAFLRREIEPSLPLGCPFVPPVDERALGSLGMEAKLFLDLIENCQDGRKLMQGLQDYVEALEGPSVWLDAASANLFGALAFLRANPSGLAILMRRHALEHITALMAVGYGFKEAARLWFAEAALGRYIAEQLPEQVRLVDREDLIRNTRVVLDSLSDWLGVGRIIPLVSHPVQLPAAELEERHLAYLFGLKLAPDFARLIGEAAPPAWRGAEMVEWTGARLPEGLSAREELDRSEKSFVTQRGQLLSRFVGFSPAKPTVSQSPKTGGGIRGWLHGLFPRKAPVAAPVLTLEKPAVSAAVPCVPKPDEWNSQAVSAVRPSAGVAELVGVIVIESRHDLVWRTVEAVLEGPTASTPTRAVVLVATNEQDWRFACAVQKENSRVFPVAAPSGPAGATWQVGVRHARTAAPAVLLLIEPGQIMVGTEYIGALWSLLDHGRGSSGLLGFDLVAAVGWTLLDSDPLSDHFGRRWSVRLRDGCFAPTLSICRAFARDFLECADWRVFDETSAGNAHQNAWQRAIERQAHFHLAQHTTVLSVAGAPSGSNGTISGPAVEAGLVVRPLDFCDTSAGAVFNAKI